MAHWLFKEEPTNYSFADLERDGRTVWSGVSNALARKHLRQISPGDHIFYYHTGDEKAIVGVMEAIGGPRADETSDDPKAVVVEVQAKKRLKIPVTLAAVKSDPAFASWELVRVPRLSVMPVNDEMWRRIEELGRGK